MIKRDFFPTLSSGGSRLNVGYARVSSSDQRQDLVRQQVRLRQALGNGSDVVVISDLGSGLNFKKRGLAKLLSLIMSGQVAKLVVTHKDRLLRFGYELVEKMVKAHGGEIVVLEEQAVSSEDELTQDVLSVITVFSAKLYGRRSHEHRKASTLIEA